jgi:WhiB family redox-sensing transcriptional regulator
VTRIRLTVPGLGGPVTLFELFNLGSPDSTDWVLSAACAGTDPELFFPGRGQPNRDAKQVCASCSVRAECLEDALERRDFVGVRGGLSPRERYAVARQRKAAGLPESATTLGAVA